MIRGATPTLTFSGFPFDTSKILNVRATFVQGGAVIFQKEMAEMLISPDTVKIRLQQEDTLKFAAGYAEVSLKFFINDGNAMPTISLTFPVSDTYDTEVIV